MSENTEVTLYTKPGCVQCTASKRSLDDNNVIYTTVDLTEDDSAIALVKELGYLGAPVITTPNKHWQGFRPDFIKEVAQHQHAA